MNNVGHVNRVEEMDLKVAIVTALPDNPNRPHGDVEAVSVNLVQVRVEFDDLDIHFITTRRTYTPLRIKATQIGCLMNKFIRF